MTPSARLRYALSRLLGERVMLAVARWLLRGTGWRVEAPVYVEPMRRIELYGSATVVEGIAAEEMRPGQIVARGTDGLFRLARPVAVSAQPTIAPPGTYDPERPL